MIRSALVLSLLLISFQFSRSQWVQTSGPPGAVVSVLLPDGPDLYVGTQLAGIYKSTDGGTSWLQKNNGFGYKTAGAMARCGPYLLASGSGVLFRSSDGGDSWTPVPGFETSGGILTLSVQGTHAIAGTAGGGVYVSSDTGGTWSPSNAGLPLTVDDLSVPVSVAAGPDYIVFASTFDSSDMFKSTDLGASWLRDSTGLPSGEPVQVLYNDGATIYAGINSDLYQSTDLGGSWSYVSSTPNSVIRSILNDGSTLFSGGSSGLFASSDGGIGWTRISGRLGEVVVNGLAMWGPDIFAGTFVAGVFKSTDNGSAWSPSNDGIRGETMSNFISDGASLYGNTGSIFRTTDGGDTWVEVRGDLATSVVAPRLIYADGDTLILDEDWEYNKLNRSMDGGVTWEQVGPELDDIGGGVQNIVRTASGYWTAYGGIYASTDIGTSWHLVDSAGTSGGSLIGMELVNGALFAFGGKVFRSTDDGATWEEVTPSSFPSGHADMMTAVGSTVFLGDSYSHDIWRSTDGGSTWGAVSHPTVGGSITQLYASDTMIFACIQSTGIFMSPDEGSSWTDITGNLPEKQTTYSVAVRDGYLFAGTFGNSVWRRPTSGLTAIDEAIPGIPLVTALVQNYPNPFNPSTRIRFQLPRDGSVTLRIYNLLGEQIATLVDGSLEAGYHSIEWDASAFPTGVYYYRMQTPGFNQVKKMILLK